MEKDIVKLAGGTLLGLALVAALAACGGGATPAPATPQGTAIGQPTLTPVPKPAAAGTAAPAPTRNPTQSAVPPSTPAPAPTVSAGGGDLLAKGKPIYEKTAGGVGCAYCHSLDGKGKGPGNPDSPNIRGKDEGAVRAAISRVPVMSFIKLSDEEITVVVAYLKYLSEQP